MYALPSLRRTVVGVDGDPSLSRQRAAIVRAMARAREVRDGADDSGTITIVIDDDGMPRDVVVAADWRRRLGEHAVGPALVAADTDAAHRRAAATAEAMAKESTEDDDASGHGGVGWSAWLVPVEPDASARSGRSRSLSELSAAVWAAFDDLDRVTGSPPAVDGSGADGAVRVTMISGRITACTINPGWLARQDELTLAHALREAVCAAATAGVTAHRPLIEYHQRLATLVADAKSTLNAITRGARHDPPHR